MTFPEKELARPASSWREQRPPFCYTVPRLQLRSHDAYGAFLFRETSPACLCRRGYPPQHDARTFLS